MKNVLISKQSVIDFILVLFCAILLCFMGFYNNFPYVYSDCGTYIGSGFDLKVPIDRPIFYGLFIRHASLMTSIWLVVLVQGFMVSLALFYFFKYLSGTTRFRLYYIAFIVLITFFTSASFHVSQLLPDVFTSVTILTLGLLLLAPKMSKRDIIITSFMLILSISVHNSHFLISIALLGLFSLVFFVQKFRHKLDELYISLRRLVFSWIVVIFSFLMVCTVQYKLGGGFALSRASQVFLMSRLHDAGLLEPYLQETCGKYHFKMCEYKGKLPYSLIWDYANNPLYVGGTWDTPEKLAEYKAIVTDLITSPKYGKLYAATVLESGFTQFFCFSLLEALPQREDSPSFMAISAHFPTYVKQMRLSLQWNQYLGLTQINQFINEFQNWITGICLLIYLASMVYPSRLRGFNRVFLFILMGLLINAFVCGAFSGISVRYQCRIIWLLPLPIFLFLANKEFLLDKVKRLFSPATDQS